MITMRLIKLAAIPVIGLSAGLGLAACGSSTPTPAVTVTASAAPTTPAAATPAAAAPAQPAPVKTVYAQAPAVPAPAVPAPAVPAPAAPALTACGTGTQGEEVYAGADTSCPFALNVEQDYANGGYWYQAGTSQFYSYSPVTGQSYLMTSSSGGNPVVVTGGDNALVQFNF